MGDCERKEEEENLGCKISRKRKGSENVEEEWMGGS